MYAWNFRIPDRAGAFLLALALGLSLGQAVPGQAVPPAELLLKGKVRDFIEDNPVKTPIHPHFYGNRAHQPGCSSQEAGVNIVQADIDTTNDIGDTSIFKGDNRGPKLISPLDPRVAQCFDPVNRFGDWYNDKPAGDVNRPFLIDIKFTRNPATGLYEYFNDEFFPIDNGKAFRQLGPNPPFGHLLPGADAAHDFGFTMEFHANFTYFKGAKQAFTFRGDDDVWVFFNGKRIIDLGGIHPSQDASVNLDDVAAAIGLQDSLVYPLDFFFAERHTTTSKLRITTSLELEPVLGKPTVTPGRYFDGQVSVTATHTSTAAVLYYTTDGSTPDAKSQKYTGPITLSATTVLKVIAIRPGYRNSDVVTETFTKMQTVATPVANPTGRIFVNPISVALSEATPGAVIRYTLDGSVPDLTSPVYTASLAFTKTTTLSARAFLLNWVPSAVMKEVYTDAETLVPPVADPGGGGFIGTRTVTLSVPGHAGAAIRYTVDGSDPTLTSPLYSAPLTFTATTTLKAKAFQQDWKPSQAMTEEYARLAQAVKAVYVDFDGDGSMDGAVIHLDIPAAGVPASVRLIDPFANTPIVLPSAYITKGNGSGTGGDILTVRFPDKPFTPGTTFPAAVLGSFPDAAGYASVPFVISDSAGPVPTLAISHNKNVPEDHASVDITFTEPIGIAEIQAGLTWPFDIIRAGGPQGKPVRVASIQPVVGQANTYRWTFEVDSPAFPVYIDSLTLAANPAIHDAIGSPGVGGGKRIPVQGGPQTLVNKLIIEVVNRILPRQGDLEPDISQVRQNPFAVIVNQTGTGPICLDCRPGTEPLFTGDLPIPEWVIRGKYAFHYAFTIFDHLGNYVSKTEGQITEAMLAKAQQDPEGFRTLRFRWIPVAHNGAAVGTGAYILKGVVINHENEAQKGSQGEAQILKQSQSAVFATFGYLRQRQ